MNQKDWEAKGKTIRQLILELQSFENQELEVLVSTDAGSSLSKVSLVAKVDGKCHLIGGLNHRLNVSLTA